jgi:hypothetical protein
MPWEATCRRCRVPEAITAGRSPDAYRHPPHRLQAAAQQKGYSGQSCFRAAATVSALISPCSPTSAFSLSREMKRARFFSAAEMRSGVAPSAARRRAPVAMNSSIACCAGGDSGRLEGELPEACVQGLDPGKTGSRAVACRRAAARRPAQDQQQGSQQHTRRHPYVCSGHARKNARRRRGDDAASNPQPKSSCHAVSRDVVIVCRLIPVPRHLTRMPGLPPCSRPGCSTRSREMSYDSCCT